jgi:hypothetical protein
MMDNFTHILQRLLMVVVETSLKIIHFRGATPFKVQVNFDIPLFEGDIDANSLERWLNLLEGYYSVQKNSDGENITFILLKSIPHVRAWWEVLHIKITHFNDDLLSSFQVSQVLQTSYCHLAYVMSLMTS